MIQINKIPGQKILEFGGGQNRHPSSDVNVDCRPGPGVDLVADFNKPLEIQTGEWDAVLCIFALEHISYRKVPQFLSEVFRILKPGGSVIVVTANTEAQVEWIQNHPDGWDNKESFDSNSCILFGDQDYPENSHRSYFSPTIAVSLFQKAGFEGIRIQPYGESSTDMGIIAVKPQGGASYWRGEEPREKVEDIVAKVEHENDKVDKVLNDAYAAVGKAVVDGSSKPAANPPAPVQVVCQRTLPPSSPDPAPERGTGEARGQETPAPMTLQGHPAEQMMEPPERLFDRDYFCGGGKVGGYAHGIHAGLADFPQHEITARHILARHPASVLELGVARGYVLKRIQDAGVPGLGLEISRHCWMTRVCEGVFLHNLCKTPWPIQVDNHPVSDLCYSVAVLEHVPEQHLPAVVGEMVRTCRRGLHGIDFGANDDGFDRTHVSLHDRGWWCSLFKKYAPNWPVEIFDKEDLENGPFPVDALGDGGLLKLNVGCGKNQFHHGWINIDHEDLSQFSQACGYRFHRADVRQGLPFGTGDVDLIYSSRFLQRLTYRDGLAMLRDFRRLVKPTGVVRIVVPDTKVVALGYCQGVILPKAEDMSLSRFDDVSESCANAPTEAGKLWALLHEGAYSCWDHETLEATLRDAGFTPKSVGFRETLCGDMGQTMLRETLDNLDGYCLVMEAVPLVGAK